MTPEEYRQYRREFRRIWRQYMDPTLAMFMDEETAWRLVVARSILEPGDVLNRDWIDTTLREIRGLPEWEKGS